MAEVALTENDRALLSAPNFACVSTLRADGSIHTVVTWVDVDGGDVLLNAEQRRAWLANLRERRRVTVTVLDRDNPYQYVSITGTLTAANVEGAFEQGDRMAQKYLNQPSYPYHREGDVRVLIRVTPQRVVRVHQRR